MNALPQWASRQHPIVQRELRRWERARTWGWASHPWSHSAIGLLFLPILCGLLFTSTLTVPNPERLAAFGQAFTLAAFGLSFLVEAFVVLLINIVGATLMTRERETQSWPFLRLTLLTDGELLGSKLAALLYILRESLLLVLALRGVAVSGGLLIGGGSLFFNPASQFNQAIWYAGQGRLDLAWYIWVGIGLLFVTLLLSLTLGPLLNFLYNGLVSLTVSTFLRARSTAIGVTFVLHFVLSIGVYAPAQLIAVRSLITFIDLYPYAHRGEIHYYTLTFWQMVHYSLMLGIMALCYRLALRRIAGLGE